ncbi:M4 family metallopeptidase [Streptomyces sp. WAC06614]|uniref:M4 family metallopeptidase n=1 Tax=Streptomyces sp. WAC06614 TaxID=2487416 RepID=UPI000F76E596|nr:M4 family metallopeptidase [Streptomyces sp. WAC06614]RSS84368.1 peptidase M4 family protein [Streptomyces sp. WAC06614]
MLYRTRCTAAAAALALTACLAGAVAGSASAASPAPQPAPPERGRSLALAAADQAASSGLDGLRHGPDEKLVRTSVTPWADGLFYTAYQRTYRGVPVHGGGDAVVLADSSGTVRNLAAAASPALSLSTRATVPAAAAAATARAQLASVEEATEPELTVLVKDGKGVLAWHVLVAGRTARNTPSGLDTYVDATTGKVVRATEKVRHADGRGYHNGNVTIDTAATSMTDTGRGSFKCGGQNGSAYTGSSPWGNGGANDLVTACVDIMYAAQRESDMLKQWFGYNGINGQGGMVPARAGLSEVNAYYDGTKTTYGRNQNGTMQLTGIDVVAHEYGHEIFDKTPGSSGSSNENGGMNESTGDIFGALTEHFANNPNDTPDYTVGEKLNFLGDNKPIRYMYNPSLANNDPNCYNQLSSGTEVHAAAGPQNHWFYLLAEGSNPGGGKPASPICAGGPSSVTGIGIQKAGKIFMGALLMKTSAWNHPAARKATLASAKNTYGSAECQAVKAAWDAIRVPAQSGETDCGGTNTPDFTLALDPTSGSAQPGASVTATVKTSTVGGDPQTVQLSASGQPGGVTVSFSPSSVTSGNAATMTVSVAAGTPNGTYPITVTGTGSATHSVTYTLAVGTTTPPTGCENTEYTYRGTLASGQSAAQPDGSYYWSATSGTHTGCLRGPAGTDFDLYLQKWNGSGWVNVAVSGTEGENEDISYNGSPGYYRYVIHAYSGSGAYTLGLSAP